MIDLAFWRGRRVFITGHTGFKGSWLCLWLSRLGADVTGYALAPPTDPSLFVLARVAEGMRSIEGDVRDLVSLRAAMSAAAPEVVIHLAAQSLVRFSYANPVETFATNVLGSVHALEAARTVPPVRAIVMVTSDKCYKNNEWHWGYRESEALGGHDPYSASKACAEIAIGAYQASFYADQTLAAAVASARAGNVIGGGDWGQDRLIPDILRSLLRGEPTLIRKPEATRPWQHVLEPLQGYLMLAERLHGQGRAFAGPWNFGPPEHSERTVGWIIEQLYGQWGAGFSWQRDANPGPPESTFLKLDASKARAQLGWQTRLDLPTTLRWIVEWTRSYQAGADMRATSLADIDRYISLKTAA